MPEAPQPSRRCRFGVFEVDLRAGELRKRGLQVRLQEQPFQVLVTLMEHPGEVVTREELQKKLWPGDTFVDFDHGLNKAINKIREALGDSAESPRFVETVTRRGYRFLAEVRAADATPEHGPEPSIEAASQAKERSPASLPEDLASHKRLAAPLAWAIAVLVLLLLIPIAWTFYSRNRAAPPIRSLAVLPLVAREPVR